MASKEESEGSESLANSREQRKNAGNKMSKLLADELGDDEFYKTALGGFAEESGDDEYASEAEESDQADSDFSMSETDEIIEQDDDDDGKKRKKTFYKKPKPPAKSIKTSETTSKAGQSEVSVTTEKKTKKDKMANESRRKSSRALTMRESVKHQKRIEGVKKVDKKQVKFSQTQLRPLTQKELLAEAEITEQINIAALKAYRQMEETKKKAKNLKPVRKEPMIRFLSLSMPLIESNEDTEIKVDDDVGIENQSETPKEKEEEIIQPKCSRNFIIFSDPKTFPGDYFASNKVSIPQKAYCPVTGLPAKYKDPVTGLPYATAQAFRYIREHYSKQTAEAEEKTSEGRSRSSQRLAQQPVTVVEAT